LGILVGNALAMGDVCSHVLPQADTEAANQIAAVLEGE
jgi:hypothetical protein